MGDVSAPINSQMNSRLTTVNTTILPSFNEDQKKKTKNTKQQKHNFCSFLSSCFLFRPQGIDHIEQQLEGVFLGKFSYSKDGDPIQTFALKASSLSLLCLHNRKSY